MMEGIPEPYIIRYRGFVLGKKITKEEEEEEEEEEGRK